MIKKIIEKNPETSLSRIADALEKILEELKKRDK